MSNIIASQSRQSVQVRLPDGRIFEGPHGTPLLEFIHEAEEETQPALHERAIAAMSDNRLRELTYAVRRDMDVRPLTLLDADGTRIYRRSLAFLLVTAAQTCFPEARVFIDHALPQRAFFCHVENRANFTQEELARLREEMQNLVDGNYPIKRTRMSLDEARNYFAERSDQEKVRLLQFRSRDYLRIYTLRDFSDYFYGYMVPTTDYLRWFDLESTPEGFLLRYPSEDTPNQIQPVERTGMLNDIFLQASEWLKLLNVRDIGHLNEAIQHGHARELILIAEALHERRIAEIGKEVAERHKDGVRICLIAGPSSSGKTTFSKRLAIQLMTHGLKPFTLELDTYFVDREKTPRDYTGDYDFESLLAINTDLLNEQLKQLIAGERTQLPSYDFKAGKSMPGHEVQLTSEHVVILEGHSRSQPGFDSRHRSAGHVPHLCLCANAA